MRGGYIADDVPERIFSLAAEMGVTNFVLPGNKLEAAERYALLLDKIIGRGAWKAYAPGFLTQGGEPSEFAQMIDDRPAFAIAGSAIYTEINMTVAAEQLVQQLNQ